METNSITLYKSDYDKLMEESRILHELKKKGTYMLVDNGFSYIITKEEAVDLVTKEVCKTNLTLKQDIEDLKKASLEETAIVDGIIEKLRCELANCSNRGEAFRNDFNHYRGILNNKKWYQFIHINIPNQ